MTYMLAQESWYSTEQLRVATQEIHVNYVTKKRNGVYLSVMPEHKAYYLKARGVNNCAR